MNRHAQFVAIVQTGAIIHAVRRMYNGTRPEAYTGALGLVARAVSFDGDAIPEDVERAAHEFLGYALSVADGRAHAQPAWYAEIREAHPSWVW